MYQLQIEVGTPEVFQVLELCSIFGLSSLESHCVDRIMSQLSSNNVCSVLSMAGNLVEKGSICFNSVVDRCVMYIELHAKEVVDTEGFLQLSRDSLIQLISSDKVMCQLILVTIMFVVSQLAGWATVIISTIMIQ